MALLLPNTKGKYSFSQPIAPLTWFQVGGVAEVLFKPHDIEDLLNFISEKPQELNLFILGAGSNVLVRDGGINGAVIKLGKNFNNIEYLEDTVEVGAACLDRTLAMHCLEQGFGGLEFLISIPGTIGGAIAMNAGAYGSEIKDILSWVEIIDNKGKIQRLTPDNLQMTYRNCNLPEGAIVVKAALKGYKADPNQIQEKIQKFLQMRSDSQPTKGRTGGSTFKNPDTQKAWELIDIAGCRGWREGNAMISEKHCNFLLNLGSCKAANLENLGERVRTEVLLKTGVNLEWEIKRMGFY